MNRSIVDVPKSSQAVSIAFSTPTPRLLMTANEAAQALSICPRTLWTLTHAGQIPFVRIGRLVRYSPDDLRGWIDRQKSAIRQE